ncbi:Ras-related protein Rab-22A [Tritrichomonas foetus]|uniref:Ras-related protein Rab-22A n=1 Tax=Tritrichomonas foetus TaxID=1144522 RepID=A0A1J4L2Z7_9EUKA|nr:Ras-related protein Rab-22A [Tritrichomonas foetus]|eukprot:OHT16293.1 Ras-related protein Rab-22A [Tritrichomonas foetus]
MTSLLQSESYLLKIVFIGESGSGKTSIVSRFINDTFSEDLSPTIGASFINKTISYQEKNVELSLWDTAGQEAYRGLMPMYYRNAIAAVIVFDVTKQESFNKVQSWIDELKNACDAITMIICGNKIDLEDKRIITTSDAQNLANIHNINYCEVSAKENIGIQMLFQKIVRLIDENSPDLIERMKNKPEETFDNNDSNKKGDCC